MSFQALLEFFVLYRPDLIRKIYNKNIVTLAVLSSEADKSKEPSQLKEIDFTGAECPFKICELASLLDIQS